MTVRVACTSTSSSERTIWTIGAPSNRSCAEKSHPNLVVTERFERDRDYLALVPLRCELLPQPHATRAHVTPLLCG